MDIQPFPSEDLDLVPGRAGRAPEQGARRADEAVIIEAAGNAQRRAAFREAYALFSSAWRQNRKNLAALQGMAQAVRDAGWPEVADDLLALHGGAAAPPTPSPAEPVVEAPVPAAPAFDPAAPAFDPAAIERAWQAHKQRNWSEAAALWAAVREGAPSNAAGYIQGAIALRELGKPDAARVVLDQGIRRLPDEASLLIEQGWLAQYRRQWAEAASVWRAVRARFPDATAGYLGGSTAAAECGDGAEAERLATEAMRRAPADAGGWVEFARAAQRRRDWGEAQRRWAEVLARFPDHPAGYSGTILANRELKRFAEAEAVANVATGRFKDVSWPHFEHAWVAHVARDWPEAAKRWAQIRARFPDHSVGWTAGAVTLREQFQFEAADALLEEAMARFPAEQNPVVEYAWLASARRDWVEATRRWATVRQKYPDLPVGWLRGAAAHSEVWQYSEAEAILRDGMARLPRESELAAEYAAIAMRERRNQDAEQRFRELRDRFPDLVAGHRGLALALRDQFRLDEAAAVLEQGQKQLPNEPSLYLEHAILPMFAPLRRDRDPETAIRRLRETIERFPTHEEAYLRFVRVLLDENRLDEADAVVTAGMAKLPNSPGLATEFGNIARRRGDADAAIERFTTARARFRNDPGAAIGLGTALAQAGRDGEAELVLTDVMRRFPQTQAAYVAYAEIAMRLENWPEALTRWTEAHRRFPDDNGIAQRIFDVRLHLTAEGSGSAAAEQVPESTDPRAELRDIVMQFESLGGRGIGCEFGMFQREFGAEPLGLLRWADMPFEGIVHVLETRFEGVGLEENTDVFVNRENTRPEYCTVDKRGFMFMRAFVYEDEMPMERMRRQALRRLKFLKDKLIADLEAGQKIFLWRCTERTLSEPELSRLHGAVRAYGDNMLFYVRYADAGHPNGTVEIAAPGLMIGYIDRFKMSPDGVLSSAPPSASWIALCRSAYAMWSGLRHDAAAAAS